MQISDPVDDGATASITSSPLSPGTYRWRARTVDQHGAASGWVNFGTHENDRTFITNPAPKVTETHNENDDED
jgi:hypothetical protein